MGPALQAAFLAMQDFGGKLLLFQSAVPSLGEPLQPSPAPCADHICPRDMHARALHAILLAPFKAYAAILWQMVQYSHKRTLESWGVHDDAPRTCPSEATHEQTRSNDLTAAAGRHLLPRLFCSSACLLRANSSDGAAVEHRPGQDKEPGQRGTVGHRLGAQAAEPGRPVLQEVCGRMLPRPDCCRRLRPRVRTRASHHTLLTWLSMLHRSAEITQAVANQELPMLASVPSKCFAIVQFQSQAH